MMVQRQKVKGTEIWGPPQQSNWKFNIDGASKGKPRPAGIDGILRNYKRETAIMFNESVGIKDSNEAEILSSWIALIIWKDFGDGNLVIERDSTNAFK